MRAGDLQPNALELALLACIAAESPELRLDLSDIRVVKRTLTGVGSFTDFVVAAPPQPSGRRVINVSATVSIPGLQYGLGVVAFLEGAELTLEMYSHGGDQWDGGIDGFEVFTTTA